jgi:hypothetical protein
MSACRLHYPRWGALSDRDTDPPCAPGPASELHGPLVLCLSRGIPSKFKQ